MKNNKVLIIVLLIIVVLAVIGGVLYTQKQDSMMSGMKKQTSTGQVLQTVSLPDTVTSSVNIK